MKAAIFDLDGTLLDTIGDIADSTNHAITSLGYQPCTVDKCREVAGAGNETILRRLLKAITGKDPDPHLVAEGVRLKSTYEDGPKGHIRSKLFPGTFDLLTTLQEAGIQLAILSNKAEHNVREIVNGHLPGIQWKYVAGARDDTPLKPDPTAALQIVRDHFPGVKPSECIFVGDTDIDMKTAISAGMTPIAVPWGFRSVEELRRSGAEIIVTKAHEIADFILSKRN